VPKNLGLPDQSKNLPDFYQIKADLARSNKSF
jgi:hypothetical protein